MKDGDLTPTPHCTFSLNHQRNNPCRSLKDTQVILERLTMHSVKRILEVGRSCNQPLVETKVAVIIITCLEKKINL